MIETLSPILAGLGLALLPALAPPVPEAADKMAELAGVFSGTWSVTETTEPAERGGTPVTRRGETRWWTPPGGMPLVQETRLAGDEGATEEMTTLWWDATARQFRGVYCASFNAQGCSNLTLDWTGTQAVVKGSYQLGTKTHRYMDVYTFDSPESYTRTHAVGEPSMDLKRVSTTRGTIVKDKAR